MIDSTDRGWPLFEENHNRKGYEMGTSPKNSEIDEGGCPSNLSCGIAGAILGIIVMTAWVLIVNFDAGTPLRVAVLMLPVWLPTAIACCAAVLMKVFSVSGVKS